MKIIMLKVKFTMQIFNMFIVKIIQVYLFCKIKISQWNVSRSKKTDERSQCNNKVHTGVTKGY